ncbi:RidA family protein [Xanthomonas sp. AM6]|uniref:RidA family protein n=1 Tax=Xanthomonas sp. AM6 TaxID=2982531 RepID=UPI0021D7EABD|nr:RidA family protein [Xanthomonas sp. AM6]UYB51128.1 RidA family protein [Xanthomonas sp. AM6]
MPIPHSASSDTVSARLRALGLALPPPLRVPDGVILPFAPVHVVGTRVLISGHGPQHPDGRMAGGGRIGEDLDEAQGYAAARQTALSMLASLERSLGSLDRVKRWVRVFGMVRCAPGFQRLPNVINGCSDLLLALWGPELGQHARSAVGMAELPFGIPVEIEAEAELH